VYHRIGGSPYDRLRRIVASAAVELAFRRYLSEHEIPFDVKAVTPFTEPERYDVSLAGRRCAIQSFFISRREQALQIKRSPEVLLKVPALVASDQNAAEGHWKDDIYLFAFLAGLVTSSKSDLQKVIETSQSHYFVHVMPEAWIRPPKWNPLGTLALKSDSEVSQRVEIGGQDSGRESRSLQVEIPPKRRIQGDQTFFSVAYIHHQEVPTGQVGIYSPVKKQMHMVGESDWENIWVYGLDIVLVGYLPREEFNRRASFVHEGARVFQYDRTRTKNLAVNVCDLKPVSELLERTHRGKL